ncbi:MAG: hypothetical protein ACOY90_07690 [Candidatus Zhuqueibacterota bacterium]
MKTAIVILKIFLILCVLVLIGFPLLFLFFGLETAPLVERQEQLTVQDLARVEQLLRANDPRKLKIDEIKSVTFSERDLNLFIDYAFARSDKAHQIAAKTELQPHRAIMMITVTLPNNRFGSYLNIAVFLAGAGADLGLEKVKIGQIAFPGWFFTPIFWLGHKFLQDSEEYRITQNIKRAIRDIRIENDQLTVVYQWRPEILDQIQARGRRMLIPVGEKERWLAYNDRLYTLSNSLKGQKNSIIQFLPPLFQLASERTAHGNDAISENKILILSLAMFGTGSNMDRIVRFLEIDGAQQPRRIKMTLLRREDLAKHFMVSAALTLSGGGDFANVMGVYKEYGDSKGGSGFSYADLAADRAGMTFAQIATASEIQARAIQARMSQATLETDFMPRVDALQEGIQTYEGAQLDEATLKIIEKEIDARIRDCRIYQ